MGVELGRWRKSRGGVRYLVRCEECGWFGEVLVVAGGLEEWLRNRTVCPSGTHALKVMGKGLQVKLNL